MTPENHDKLTKLIIVACAVFIIACITAATASPLPIEQQSEKIHSYSWNDSKFVRNIGTWIYTNIDYHQSPEWEVNSTDITWKGRVGDCSEMSLLAERMISPYLKTKLAYGMLPGVGLHDTLKVEYGGKWHYYDRVDEQGFEELGEGLHPKETIVF